MFAEGFLFWINFSQCTLDLHVLQYNKISSHDAFLEQ